MLWLALPHSKKLPDFNLLNWCGLHFFFCTYFGFLQKSKDMNVRLMVILNWLLVWMLVWLTDCLSFFVSLMMKKWPVHGKLCLYHVSCPVTAGICSSLLCQPELDIVWKGFSLRLKVLEQIYFLFYFSIMSKAQINNTGNVWPYYAVWCEINMIGCFYKVLYLHNDKKQVI